MTISLSTHSEIYMAFHFEGPTDLQKFLWVPLNFSYSDVSFEYSYDYMENYEFLDKKGEK